MVGGGGVGVRVGRCSNYVQGKLLMQLVVSHVGFATYRQTHFHRSMVPLADRSLHITKPCGGWGWGRGKGRALFQLCPGKVVDPTGGQPCWICYIQTNSLPS